MNAEEAIRLARLAAAAGLPMWVKLEIHPDPHYLLPDPIETLAAATQLVKEGFVVLPYINADPVLARRLQDVGTATVMPLGSPSEAIADWIHDPRSKSLLSKPRSPLSWMPASAHPAMLQKPLKWAPTRFW